MLRAASLPPSMAKREKTRPKFDVCPRSFKDLDCSNAEQRKGHKASKSGQKYRNQYEIKEFEELKNEFLYPNLKIKPTKRGKRVSSLVLLILYSLTSSTISYRRRESQHNELHHLQSVAKLPIITIAAHNHLWIWTRM